MDTHKVMDTHKIMTYYQSSLRTCGQYILVSLGLIGYSRFYRGKKNDLYNIAFIILSLLILVVSSLICVFLIKDLNNLIHKSDSNNEINKWLIIPKIILISNIAIGGFGLYTLFREIKNL
tara:strand:- start:84 stop:443 length:360 start_codon:yes stop_codon:yes gene_type:complete